MSAHVSVTFSWALLLDRIRCEEKSREHIFRCKQSLRRLGDMSYVRRWNNRRWHEVEVRSQKRAVEGAADHVDEFCHCCGKSGHASSECRHWWKPCDTCGKHGHLRPMCKIHQLSRWRYGEGQNENWSNWNESCKRSKHQTAGGMQASKWCNGCGMWGHVKNTCHNCHKP